ncbi:MAG: ketol-acid reductoisomerase [Planctomycetota bacterium]|nr:ketol-acid reductoisomerase [Planctomycetota bacterium]
MKTLRIGGVREDIIERGDVSPARLKKILGNETVAVIGYGVQGYGQSLNMRDNGVEVIVGVRKGGDSWIKARKDGWKPGETLFDIGEAVRRGTVVQYLLSDAGQKSQWPLVRENLNEGDALYFSHGFSIAYHEITGVVPPKNVDVILVAPKGSGTTLRRHFLEGRGINSSFAIGQDYTGRARERAIALGIAIGSGYLFETTFKNEVFSDLVGERGVLMGAIYGLWLAQYETLRERGHSPSEAFNETVEEATQSLYPLIAENGMDWMYANCSTTAQRGALDWFKSFRDATKPVFDELYDSVATGKETRRVLRVNSKPDYRKRLERELSRVRESEMWRIGAELRALRPENQPGKSGGAIRKAKKKTKTKTKTKAKGKARKKSSARKSRKKAS